MKKTKWIAVTAGVCLFVLDRVFKRFLCDETVVLLPGILQLTPIRNTGMALGLFQNGVGWIIAISVMLLAACVIIGRKMAFKGIAGIGIALLLSGAISNLIDRIALGYVQDYFEVLFMQFYVFNWADIGVVIGAILCAAALMFRPQDFITKKRQKQQGQGME